MCRHDTVVGEVPSIAQLRLICEVQYIAWTPVRLAAHRLRGLCVQAKEGGRKVVAVISSNAACVTPVAAAARDADSAPGFFDVIMPAYKASKAALNRCECPERLSLRQIAFAVLHGQAGSYAVQSLLHVAWLPYQDRPSCCGVLLLCGCTDRRLHRLCTNTAVSLLFRAADELQPACPCYQS